MNSKRRARTNTILSVAILLLCLFAGSTHVKAVDVTYLGTSPNLYHLMGQPQGTAWIGTTSHGAEWLTYGPYANNYPVGQHVATFRLWVDNNSANNAYVARLDVFDSVSNSVLATLDVRRRDFNSAQVAQDFKIPFQLHSAAVLQFRVFVQGVAYIKHLQTVVSSTPQNGTASVYFGSSASHNHLIGQAQGSSWMVNTSHGRGWMSFGPSANFPAGQSVVTFRLMVDNITADNLRLMTLDVFDSVSNSVIASLDVKRKDFASAFIAHDFSLAYELTAPGNLQFRVHVDGKSYIQHLQTVHYPNTNGFPNIKPKQAFSISVPSVSLVGGQGKSFGPYALVMQLDGNLVLYKGSVAVWHTETFGQSCNNCLAVLQADGNFVLYNGGQVRWHSHTYGNAGARFVSSDVSPLVIQKADRSGILWDATGIAIEFAGPEAIVETTAGYPTGSPCPTFPPAPGSNETRVWLPDGPVRAISWTPGRFSLISPHYLTYALTGNVVTGAGGIKYFENPQPDCSFPIADSAQLSDWSRFLDDTWLSSPYILPPNVPSNPNNGVKAVSLNHEEFHSWAHFGGPHYRFWSVTLSTSTNGSTFRSDDGNVIVGRPPLAFGAPGTDLNDPTTNRGFEQPTNIVRSPLDGMFYAIVDRPDNIHCVIRTNTPHLANTWRAWDGHSFDALPQLGEYCESVTPPGAYSMTSAGLYWSQALNRFVYLMFGTRFTAEDQGTDELGGFYIYLSLNPQMTAWKGPIQILHGPTPWGAINTQNRHGRPAYVYPSFVDANAGPNYETLTGLNFDLYFIRLFSGELKRDIVRIPVTIKKNRPEIPSRPVMIYRVGSQETVGVGCYMNGLSSTNGGAYCCFDCWSKLTNWYGRSDLIFNDLPKYLNHGNNLNVGTCPGPCS